MCLSFGRGALKLAFYSAAVCRCNSEVQRALCNVKLMLMFLPTFSQLSGSVNYTFTESFTCIHYFFVYLFIFSIRSISTWHKQKHEGRNDLFFCVCSRALAFSKCLSQRESALSLTFMPYVFALEAMISHQCLMSPERQQQPNTIKSVIT